MNTTKSIRKSSLRILMLANISICWTLAFPVQGETLPENTTNFIYASAASSTYSTSQKPILVTPDAMRTRSVGQLVQELNHKNPATRSTAAYYIGELGKKASSAVDMLCKTATLDENKWVRRSATKALGKVGTTEAIAGLHLAANDQDPWVSHSARNALAKLGSVSHSHNFKPTDERESRATVMFRAYGNNVSRATATGHNLP